MKVIKANVTIHYMINSILTNHFCMDLAFWLSPDQILHLALCIGAGTVLLVSAEFDKLTCWKDGILGRCHIESH